MDTMRRVQRMGVMIAVAGGWPAFGQPVDHPVITEVFNQPIGLNDGPVGRDPANLHQEYIELYLPPAADLRLGLNKDALRLTFYEVEGDSTSSGNGLVNYRFDLPTFDLDPSNGTTAGAIARPTSGVVVIGWVDYIGNPPVGLAGTPSTRVALIDGGVTSTTDFTFVAMNGAQFTGTTNFPVPVAVSSIDLPSEASSGLIQNGSGAYLLVNRDDPGYVQLFDDRHVPAGQSADPSLATGTVLGTSALLDGFAGNDHDKFDVLEQPYLTPTGQEIDLETVLPLGGAFSLLIPQIDHASEHGYARLFVDVSKTTEDASPLNDDPVSDALNIYRTVSNVGPLFPTPGRAAFTTSPPELSIADASLQVFQVLAGTIGRPGIICANAGGHFGMVVTATPSGSSDPTVALMTWSSIDVVHTGQTPVYPSIMVATGPSAVHGATATTSVAIAAVNSNALDPPVINSNGSTTATIQILDPTTGLDALGLPFQATAFVAVQGLPRQPGVLNEFLGTSLSAFVAAHLGGLVDDERHNGPALLNPLTDLSNPVLVDSMEDDLPDDPLLFFNTSGPPGMDDFVTTIINSAEEAAGNRTYERNFNATMTAVRAIPLNINETFTAGGIFVPTERVHYANAAGRPGLPYSGLTDVTTPRGFELALLDTNVQQLGTLETGQTDDFGLIVQVGRVRPGATVVPGEFVFLSYMGGLEGADIDTLDVPPHNNQTVIIFVDLDPLDTVLGCETITQLYVVDGNGGSAVNIIEAFSLNVRIPLTFDADDDGDVDLVDYANFNTCLAGPGVPVLPACAIHDADADGDVDLKDFAGFGAAITG